MISAFFLWLALLQPAGDAAAAREEFYRALRLAQAGKAAEAVEALVELERKNPGAAWGAEALAEAGRLCEEELFQPSRAVDLYQRLLDEYPASRPASRARGRLDFLAAHLDQGPEVLAAYQKIQRQAGSLPPRESAQKMIELLEAHPGFSLAAQGKIWAAALYGQAGENQRARELLWQVAERHQGEREAAQALIELANQALAEGSAGEAERAYQRLAELGEQWRLAAQGGREQVRRLRWRLFIPPAAAAVWVCGLLWLWTAFFLERRRHPPAIGRWHLTAESWVYLAAMLPMVVLAALGSRHTTRAVLLMVPLEFLLVVPNSWWWKLRRKVGAFRLLARLLGLAVACLAGVVVAVVLSGYYDELWHTIEFGPGE